MLPRKDGRRQKCLSTKAASRACQGQTRGRHTCHKTCRVPDLPQRDLRPLLPCISAKKVAWSTALQAMAERGSNLGHPVLPEELLAQARLHHHARGGPMRGYCGYPLPVHQWESWSRFRRREDLHDKALWEAGETHQEALEATHMLEHNIKRLSQGVEDAQYPCPCSCSISHPQSKSLDGHQRSPSRQRLGRQVTFWEPDVEPDSSERPYRGPWGHSFRTYLEEGKGVPPPTQRQEMVDPQDMPITYLDVRGGQLSAWAFNQECWSMAGLAGLPIRHTTLVGRTHCHSQCGEPKEASPKNPCLFLNPGG